MQSQWSKKLRRFGDCSFDDLAVFADRVLAALFDLRDDGKPVACRRPGIDRTVRLIQRGNGVSDVVQIRRRKLSSTDGDTHTFANVLSHKL
jgi:hypothetical protein